MTISRFDFVVFVAILAAMLGIITAFYSKRFTAWKWLWVLWGVVLFWFFEIIGALSGNTLSENLVRSIPLPLLIVGTVGMCIVLNIHWIDLWQRLNGGSGVLTEGGNQMPEWLFKLLFWGLMILQYVQNQIGELFAVRTAEGVTEMQTPEGFLLMTFGAFLVFVGNKFLPELLARGLELVAIPQWSKDILQTALGAFFVALAGAIAQSPQFAQYIDKTLLSLVFVAFSALLTWAQTLVGRVQGLELKAQHLYTLRKLSM
jgi:hypothetical protein